MLEKKGLQNAAKDEEKFYAALMLLEPLILLWLFSDLQDYTGVTSLGIFVKFVLLVHF